MTDTPIALDVECYPNYFLLMFKRHQKVIYFDTQTLFSSDQRADISRIMSNFITFGFNSRNYDIPMILASLSNRNTADLITLSNKIINDNNPSWITLNNENLTIPSKWDHFDIQEPAPSVMVSLKLYGARLNSQKLQDLPIEPNTTVSPTEIQQLIRYCENDLDTTIDLYNEIIPQIGLRKDLSSHRMDLRSKSDAQIAELMITKELAESYNVYAKRPQIDTKHYKISYKVPEYVSFKTNELKSLIKTIKETEFGLAGNGSVVLPPVLKSTKIVIGETTYKIGIGGLHSQEKSQSVIPTEDQILVDADVASYYPSIILNEGLHPKHLGRNFLSVYKNIVTKRLRAKKKGDKTTNEALKIVINGTFGKLGSKWSRMYSPDLMLQVTLTGQLALLMLIERLHLLGINIVSANTDGFVSLMDKDQYPTYKRKCQQWEQITRFDLEETFYKSIHSRDVNNYFAITTENKLKNKGIFAPPSIRKNNQTPIVFEAVQQQMLNGAPIDQTITDCVDIRKFLSARTVNGGAVWRDSYLGKVVRWYYSTDGSSIHYKKNNNKVPKSDDAVPMMDLSENIPKDLDYSWYINEANSLYSTLI